MAVIGELATLITAKTAPFTRGLREAAGEAKMFGGRVRGSIGTALGSVGRILTSTTAKLGALAGALGLGGLVAKSIRLAADAEAMETSYKTYLKSMEKAKSLLAEINKFAGATPFNAVEIKEAGKQLLAFGFSADQVMPTLQVLGDLAAGSHKPIADFVDILGKVKASGVASMGDINRLADRGVPVFQELANVMGVATSEVRTLVGAGKVGFQDLWEVLNRVVGESGLFEGAMRDLAETAVGKFSSLEDVITDTMTKVGKAIMEGLNIKALQDKLMSLVETYKQDIVDATTYGVEMIMDVLSRTPEWFTKIEQFYHSIKWGAAQIARGNQALNPGGSLVVNTLLGQGSLASSGTRYGAIAAEAEERYLYLGRKATDQSRMRQYNEDVERSSRTKQNDALMTKQTTTLVDIYREHERTNRILERQQTMIVPRF